MSIAEQAALVCRVPADGRRRILELIEKPEEVIPLLPEIELCATAKALGLAEAGALLRYASDSQIVAAVDLDVWPGPVPDPALIAAWMDGLADAGDDTLLRGLESLDTEIIALYLRHQIEIFLKEDDETWEPPEGCQSLDGQVFVRARAAGADVTTPAHLLRVTFEQHRSFFLRIVQSTMWDLPADLEDTAARWRAGRLIDMGFPTWEQAMSIYAFLRPEARTKVPAQAQEARPATQTRDRARALALPGRGASAHALFEAIDELDDEARQESFVQFLELTNKVLVADGLSLGDIEAMRVAMEKVARLASQGLEAIAEANDLSEAEVLRRAGLEHVFRVGANLDATDKRARP